LKYLAKRDVETLAPEKIELAKQGSRQVSFLEPDELKRMLEAPDNDPTIVGARDKAILELLFSTGLRVSELASLRIDQVNLKRDEFTVKGKGSKHRVVFLSDGARRILSEGVMFRNTCLCGTIAPGRIRRQRERLRRDRFSVSLIAMLARLV